MRTVATLCRELISDSRTDGELLAAFVAERSEAAFLELVRRHGPLVWGACRRVLPDPADAEDAFQAAFLVLVRRAHRFTTSGAVGPWLHRVAVLTARNVRRKNARRLARQHPLPEHVAGSAPDPDLKADIDTALLALPARYRDPIILCHLQGYSRREAAERLGCAEGTLSAWLNRGLAKLRNRLHDLDPTKVLGLGAVAVPAALSANTARAAVSASVAVATIPPAISSIVEGVIHMFWIQKATAAAFALCAVFALGVGVGLGTRTEHTGAAAQDGAPNAGAVPKAETPTDRAQEIEALEKVIRALEAAHRNALFGVEAAKKRAEQTQKTLGADPKDIREDLVTLARFQKRADEVAAELRVLKDKLAKLKANKPAPANAGDDAEKDLREIKKQIAVLAAEREAIAEQAKTTEKRIADLDAAIRDYQRRAELLAVQAELAKRAGAEKIGYIELTITANASASEIVVREVPAGESAPGLTPPGTLTTRDTKVLATLLRRAKSDPNGPREVRVTVEPQAALGIAPANVLNVCDEVGFKTVKFTGYVFGGGFARQLKPDQKGDVRGYKRYDNAEVKPKELAVEIEEGLRRL